MNGKASSSRRVLARVTPIAIPAELSIAVAAWLKRRGFWQQVPSDDTDLLELKWSHCVLSRVRICHSQFDRRLN